MKKDAKDVQPEHPEGLLATAAKTIGAAVGAIVAVGGHHAGKATPPSKPARAAKLQPKNKSRLPRKQKKALKKAGVTAS